MSNSSSGISWGTIIFVGFLIFSIFGTDDDEEKKDTSVTIEEKQDKNKVKEGLKQLKDGVKDLIEEIKEDSPEVSKAEPKIEKPVIEPETKKEDIPPVIEKTPEPEPKQDDQVIYKPL